MSNSCFSLAIGTGTLNKKGEWLDVFYPRPLLNPSAKLLESISPLVKYTGGNQVIPLDSTTCHALEELFETCQEDALAEDMKVLEVSEQPRVITILATDDKPASTPEAYLKLHLLSHLNGVILLQSILPCVPFQ